MAETIVEENKKQKNVYGITPKMRKDARKRLERMIEEQGIKVAKTGEDLLGPETGQKKRFKRK
jgi:hypothetical protein